MRTCAARLSAFVALVVIIVAVLVNNRAPVLLGDSSPPSPGINDGSAVVGELAGAPQVATGKVGDGFSMPDGVVSLTFDDGPHPVWTPLILDELDRLGVTASFFVVGELVAEHPELARSIVERGHDIANHTHSHPQMGRLSQRAVRTQLQLASLMIVETTGIESKLYRPPYSGSIERLEPDEYRAADVTARDGWIVVGTDLAPRDFDPSIGAAQLVAEAMPAEGRGAIITLHDGGSDDRSRTLAALDPLVESLRAADYDVVPVSEAVEQATGLSPIRSADGGEELRATAFRWTIVLAGWAERIAIFGAITFMSLFVLRVVGLGSAALWQRAHRRPESDEDRFVVPVSVIVPAYNEEVGIEAAVRSIDATEWPELEILVVDDGSSDATSEVVAGLDMERVRLVRKPNGGKPSALNIGIREARHDVLVMIDGDTVLEPTTIPELVQPLRDPNVGAVAGNPKIGNETNLMTRLQVSEYLMSSSLERRVTAPAGLITTIPGAVGAWRRAAVTEAGLVSNTTLAEDSDLTIAVARGGWRVAYQPDARAWTEAPTTAGMLYRQRTRWTFGTLQVLWKHRRAVFDRRDGSQLGRFALPYMFLTGYVLAALAPLMDLVIIINALLGRWQLAATAWVAIATLGGIAGLIAARLDGDPTRHALLVPVQQIVFRPLLHAVAIVTLRRAFTGKRQKWGVQRRVGALKIGGAAT